MHRVVIVGGGFAGLAAARGLIKAGGFDFTLVDRKDYFEVTPAQVSALIDPQAYGGRERFYYRDVLDDHFVQGTVTEIRQGSVILESGRSLVFDQLVLATGTRYPNLPLAKPWEARTLSERTQELAKLHQEFTVASSIQVVGGGLVGLELAGQIASAAPGRKISLLHRGDRLAPSLLPAASDLAHRQLISLGVKITLGGPVPEAGPGTLVIDATSPLPATDFLMRLAPEILDDKGRIKVEANFEVAGRPGWFAIGDVNDHAEIKQATSATAQGAWLARFLSGKSKRYKSGPAVTIVPLGDRLGFSQLPFGVKKWKFLLDMKRKDYLVSLIRKNFGAH